jgi:hypothetical protein
MSSTAGFASDGRVGRRIQLLHVVVAVAVLLTVAALVVHVYAFYPRYFVDDSYITLRYAKRLIQGRGLTWTDGERVEGYTNFLWTVLIAFIGFILPKASLIDVACGLGLVSMSAALVAVLLANRPRTLREAFPALAIGLALAASGPIAAWTFGGLEQSLLGVLVISGVVFLLPRLDHDDLSFRQVLPSAAAFALAALTRPDACLFTATAAIGFVVVRKGRAAAFVSAARLAVIPFAVFCAHLLFRKLYYGAWVPNTYHAKVALSTARLQQGWDYVLTRPTAIAFLPPIALALVAAVLDAERRRRVVFLVIPLVVWVVYVIGVGGDIAPQGRHMVVAFLLLALIDLEGLSFFAARWRRVGTTVAHAFAALVLVLAAVEWKADTNRALFGNGTWEKDGAPLGRFLKHAFEKSDPLLAVDAAGSTPYYAEIDALDMLGLNDRYLAEHRPANFGKGALAHELGDHAYFLRRKPDIVMFHVPPGQWAPIWPEGVRMVNTREFRDHYVPVRFWTEAPRVLMAHFWARSEDSRIGIVRTPSCVTVPGFLLSGGPGLAAALDPHHTLATLIPPNGSADFELPMPPGAWDLHLDASGPLDPPTVFAAGSSNAPGSRVVLGAPGKVRIALRAGNALVALRTLRFDRVD